MEFIKVKNITKKYVNGDNITRALDNISFSLSEGTFNVVLGPSGSGKTTMLNMLGGMDTLTDGNITINDEQVSGMTESELTEYRRKFVGFVFQFYNIIPSLNVFENVDLVKNFGSSTFDTKEVLTSVGLENRMFSFPQNLSGGELQRVSIARAICKNPEVLLCDEPTGALDSKTGQTILKLLHDMTHRYNKTVIIVTHNAKIADMADNVIKIKDGKLESADMNTSPKQIDEIEW
ncbi:ABC transporter ATP-binding protein [Lactiplantibacillus pentosus]|jgi:putative ABC transport system ATP-binding protein|uniref:ABC transporter ATP-binding protein n=1 Tax=Lactiplantibacillus pentosus TaxID=1589 RepID=UPI00207ABC31|nr:ABC transporter ATP-binding protein [Lactiplantibacillus pentosus]USJ86043.1 ABC transporter ATP-binding protein [Lactiplantibacillus pentosus]